MYENEKREQKQMDRAAAFWEYNAIMKVVQGLRQGVVDAREDSQYYQRLVYQKYLKQRSFGLWHKVLQYLKEENKIIDSQQLRIVSKFRTIKLGRKALEALSDHAQESKIEREKNSFKSQMRSKVGRWLQDLEKKDNAREEENPGTAGNKSTEGTEEKIVDRSGG